MVEFDIFHAFTVSSNSNKAHPYYHYFKTDWGGMYVDEFLTHYNFNYAMHAYIDLTDINFKREFIKMQFMKNIANCCYSYLCINLIYNVYI